MPKTIEELQSEIERLERDNAALKTRGTVRPDSGGVSILGEEFQMRIGPDGHVLQINGAFAQHLGLASKDEIVGQKTDILRRFLNPEMLMAIARPAEGQSLVRTANDDHGHVFEVTTALHAGMLDVVIHDVTDEQQFRNLVQRYVLKDFDSLSEEDLRTFKFPERRFMTVSFTDLRGFTALTETLRPEEVRNMVNAYFEEVIRAIEANEATVAQLVGDEVMAFYGAPHYFKDHALRAIKTACEQIEKMAELCERYAQLGKEMCKCGIGINAGEVVLGNMGGAGKQTYTALGVAVNLASRLCGAARGGEVLLTETVLHAALAALPPGWEVLESHALLGGSDDDLAVGGKNEARALPAELVGKTVSIGPGIQSEGKPAEFTFRYLYMLKAKGIAKELPVIAVERSRHGRVSRFLSAERATAEQAEILLGKYRLLEVIGEGGMGKVWRARDQFGNIAALKLMAAGQGASPHQHKRFRREAAIMAKLTHHNICRIYEIGEAEGVTFIAMEFVDGVSLADVLRHGTDSTVAPAKTRSATRSQSGDLGGLVETIKQEKKVSGSSVTSPQGKPPSIATTTGSTMSVLALPLQRVLALMRTICEAIQFAHEHGVLHRDLKPDNIMIRPDGDPVVMDFGLAKFDLENREHGEKSISIEGQIVGTIEYMAPEQAQGSKQVNERADVYSLGAILYQLLTGRKHFVSSGHLLADAHKLQDYESPKLRELNDEIQPDLETIVLKALRPEPDRRYASARQLVEDLKRYEAGDPITAHPPSLRYRLAKRLRKNRAAFTVSALLACFALIFGGYTYLEHRKNWGDWTEEFSASFPAAPAGEKQAPWLASQFEFLDREGKTEVPPWPVQDGALAPRKQEWLWLSKVHLRDDVRVVVDLRFSGPPEAFQICLNAKPKLRAWNHDPPGYSCRFGVWSGTIDVVSQHILDAPSDFNDFVVSLAPEVAAGAPAGARDVRLTFQRQGEKVSLELKGAKATQHKSYLTPLFNPGIAHDGQGTAEAYDRVGFRSWSPAGAIGIRAIHVYRFKLAEKASPAVTGDALAEAGHLDEAAAKYCAVARDYRKVSDDIAVPAFAKAYLLSVIQQNDPLREDCLKELSLLRGSKTRWWWPFGERDCAPYLHRVDEVETLLRWMKKIPGAPNADADTRREALATFPQRFAADPQTRIAVDCLQEERDWPASPLRTELLQWVAKTQKLAGLDLHALDLHDLRPIAPLTSLRCLQCANNSLASLEPLRAMTDLRALYCDGNQIASLEPLHGRDLGSLYCDRNRIIDLQPLEGMPLYELSVSRNQITSLDALRGMSTLGSLDCSANQIASLEPLAGLPLYHLDCSGNRLTTLEPFVQDPPASFLFDCPTLPEAEIQRAAAVWMSKELKYHVAYARFVVARRKRDFKSIKALGSEFGSRRYLYVQQPMTLPEARKFAEQAGGRIALPTSARENAFLLEITPKDATCRIGALVAGGKLQTLSGEEIGYRPALLEAGKGEAGMSWRNGSWFPAEKDKPMAFVVQWP